MRLRQLFGCLMVAPVLLASGTNAIQAQSQSGQPGAPSTIVAPLDREHLKTMLIDLTDEKSAENTELIRNQPEDTFDVVRDNWPKVGEPDVKQRLLGLFLKSNNPHVLDVLNLGAKDTNPAVSYLAFQYLANFAFHNYYMDADGYKAWQQTVAGVSLHDIVEQGGKTFADDFTKAFASGEDSRRGEYLHLLQWLDFGDYSDLSILRRQVAVQGGVLDALEPFLKKPLVPSSRLQETIYAVRRLDPDESYVKRVIVPLLDKDNPTFVRYAAAGVLAAAKSRWSAELVFNLLVADYPSPDSWMYLQALTNASDPHLIPSLIALMEADDSSETANEMLSFTLQRLTKLNFVQGKDGGWWHIWWDRNKSSYPPDVQSVPYPKLTVHVSRPGDGSYFKRRALLRQVDDDPSRSYWLLSPAYLAPAQQPVGNGLAARTKTATFGLIVVLAGGDGNGETITEFWINAIQKALKDGYFVAVPIAPHWDANQSEPWITDQNRLKTPQARFTTDQFLTDIVKEVWSQYPIDHSRVYLHGIDEGGQAAYNSSLSTNTVFRGFYIVMGAFHTSQLPPLSHAKGRKYFLQYAPHDEKVPYIQAETAQTLLRQQSATVKLAEYDGDPGYKFRGDPWQQISAAISWLESGK